MQTTFFYCTEYIFKQNWFAKCLAEEGSVYTQRAMVSASLLDNIDMLGPYRADVVTCKPYNGLTKFIFCRLLE